MNMRDRMWKKNGEELRVYIDRIYCVPIFEILLLTFFELFSLFECHLFVLEMYMGM